MRSASNCRSRVERYEPVIDHPSRRLLVVFQAEGQGASGAHSLPFWTRTAKQRRAPVWTRPSAALTVSKGPRARWICASSKVLRIRLKRCSCACARARCGWTRASWRRSIRRWTVSKTASPRRFPRKDAGCAHANAAGHQCDPGKPHTGKRCAANGDVSPASPVASARAARVRKSRACSSRGRAG